MFSRLKKLIAVLCIAALAAVSMTPVFGENSYGASMPSLTDKSIYYLGDNVPGHLCLVSSNMFMLKRIAIMMGSPNWAKITLDEINSRGIKYKEYRYTLDGYTYHVNKYKKFSDQTIEGVEKQLKELLKDRPEGVIIYGNESQDNDLAAGKGASHGILIIEYKNGNFYGIDPSHNRNGKSKGIEKLSDTTIVTLKGVTHYMCIQDITYDAGTTNPTTTKPTTTKPTTTKTTTTTKPTNGNGTTTKPTTTKPTTTKPTNTNATTTTSSASSTLSIKKYSYPKTLTQGDKFTVEGMIQSNYKISDVNVSIIDSKGNAKISKSAKPKATKYSLSKLDNSIKFGTLKAGKYTYKVTAKDAKKSKTLVSKKFKIEPASKLKIKKARYPKELTQGASFTIKGKVTSNYKLKKVTVGVYTKSDKVITSASKKLKKKSFDIYKLDSKIKFGDLEEGTYYFKVIAKDSKKTKTVLNKKFTVKE